MSGAVIGAIVAVVAWLGLWLYLRTLNARLTAALAELAEAGPDRELPTVTIEPAAKAIYDEQ